MLPQRVLVHIHPVIKGKFAVMKPLLRLARQCDKQTNKKIYEALRRGVRDHGRRAGRVGFSSAVQFGAGSSKRGGCVMKS